MCKYCDSSMYREIGTTSKYSGIEVSIDKFGNLQVRTDNKDVVEDVAEQINKDIIKWYDIEYEPPVLNILN